MLTRRGERHREFATAVHAAFSMAKFPLIAASHSKHKLVTVDLSPHQWAGNEQADCFFERVAELLRSAARSLA